MKRRDVILATSGIVGGFALGCSDGTSTAGGTGGTTSTGGGVGSGGTTNSGGSTGGTGGGATGGSADTGGSSSGGNSTGGSGTGGAGTGGSGTGGAGTGGAGTGGGGGEACADVSSEETTTPAALHQHTLTVPLADVIAGAEKTYTTSTDQGADLHSHDVVVTAANFTTLKNEGSVDVMTISTDPATNPHDHKYTITCE